MDLRRVSGDVADATVGADLGKRCYVWDVQFWDFNKQDCLFNARQVREAVCVMSHPL